MDNRRDNLESFLRGPAPLGIDRLTAVIHTATSEYYSRTNLGFLQRLAAEARYICEQLIPAGESCAFTSQQTAQLIIVYDRVLSVIHDNSGFTDEIIDLVHDVMPALHDIVRHFEQHIEAMKCKQRQGLAELAIFQKIYDDHVEAGNFEGLLDFYPEEASAAFDGGKTPVPEFMEGVASTVRVRMASALAKSELGKKIIERVAGLPRKIIGYEKEIQTALADERRSSDILQAIRNFTSRLASIFDQPQESSRAMSAEIIPFPKRPSRIIRANGDPNSP